MPKVLIVGINGSPNREGNTSFLLQQALDECVTRGADTEVLFCRETLKDQRNPFCVACSSPCPGKCYKNKELANAYELISRADGLILGSPVYFGTISAQLKTFFDKKGSPPYTLLNIGCTIILDSSNFIIAFFTSFIVKSDCIVLLIFLL